MLDTTDTNSTDPVATIAAGIEKLASEDREHWPGSALSERLVELVELQERLASVVTRLAGRWDRSEAWKANGALAGASWLAQRTPIGRAKARRLVAAGRMTLDHPQVEERLVSSDVTTEHIDVLDRVIAKHRRHLIADDEHHLDTLLSAACGLGVDDFARVARQWATLADDQITNAEFMAHHENRGFHLSKTLHGLVMMGGALDADGGATVITALDHMAPPDPVESPDGARSLSQRRADALVELARRYLHGDQASGVGATINAVVDVAALTKSSDGHQVALTDLRCELNRVGPVGRDTMARLGCGAAFTRFVMNSPSVVLDRGRSRRLATPAQRRALAIRDRGCVFDGCGRPASWCDVHHLDPWLLGGLTDLERMVLLCRRHHVLCHEGGWRIERHPHGATITIPPDHPKRAPP